MLEAVRVDSIAMSSAVIQFCIPVQPVWSVNEDQLNKELSLVGVTTCERT